MKIKICTKCDKKRSVGKFPFKNSSKGIRHARCSVCGSAESRTHYRANKKKYMDNKRLRREKIRRAISDLKREPCTDCGKRFPPECMDFDHRGVKHAEVSHMVSVGLAIKSILKEIKKCDLVCSNCHRIRTSSRRRKKKAKK